MPFLVPALPESQYIFNGEDLTESLLVLQREGGHEVDPGDCIQVKYTSICSEQRRQDRNGFDVNTKVNNLSSLLPSYTHTHTHTLTHSHIHTHTLTLSHSLTYRENCSLYYNLQKVRGPKFPFPFHSLFPVPIDPM